MEEEKYTTFYIVRHGQTEWNAKGMLQGHQDSDLTKKGKAQIKKLAHTLKNVDFAGIYSSDLLRARRTAQIIAVERKIAVKTTEILREKNFGVLEGKHYLDVQNELKNLLDRFDKLSSKERARHKFLQEDSNEKIAARFITFLRELAIAHPGDNILVVSHGGTIRTLLLHLGFAKPEELPFGSIDNAGFVKIDSDGVVFFVKETSGIRKKEII